MTSNDDHTADAGEPANRSVKVLLCQIDDVPLAIPLAEVTEVLRAVLATPSPLPHPDLLGVFDLRSRLVPLLNARRILGLPERPIRPGDEFVVAATSNPVAGLVGLPVDEVHEISEMLAPTNRPAETVSDRDDARTYADSVVHSGLIGIRLISIDRLAISVEHEIAVIASRQFACAGLTSATAAALGIAVKSESR